MAERVPFSRRPTGCLAVARTCSPPPAPHPSPVMCSPCPRKPSVLENEEYFSRALPLPPTFPEFA